MSTFLTKYATLTAYENARAVQGFSVPNVSLIQENGAVKYLRSHISENIGVRGANGICYSLTEWNNLPSASKPAAVGAYIYDPTEGKGWVIHPTLNTGVLWSNNNSVEIPGIVTTTVNSTMLLDFAGAANTQAGIDYAAAGTTAGLTVPAFTWAAGLTWAESGLVGYIPAGGELNLIKNNITDINAIRTALGEDEIVFSGNSWLTSNQYSSGFAWAWYGSTSSNYGKTLSFRAVAVAAF